MIEGLRLGGSGVFADWEKGIGEVEVAPGECRSIPITDEIRAADAAARLARENPAHAWTLKAELSVANLKLARRKVAAGRVAVAPGRELVREAPQRARIARQARPAKGASPVAGKSVSERWVDSHFKTYEYDAETVEPVAEPAAETPAEHVALAAPLEPPQPLELPAPVPVEVLPETPPAMVPAAPKPGAAFCSMGCGQALRPGVNATEICSKCKPKLFGRKASRRTVLLAADADEHEANRLWAELSCGDKWAVLEEVLR